MFQFGRFPSYDYFIHHMMHELLSCGLLHSDICGSIHACWSPQLFAAYRVLLRLPMPRHSPCALISLTFQNYVLNFSLAILQFSRLNNFLILSFFFLICFLVSLFNFQGSGPATLLLDIRTLEALRFYGHKWTRTIDLTLIRRAL